MNERAIAIIGKAGLSLPIQHRWREEIARFLNQVAKDQQEEDYEVDDDEVAECLARHIRDMIKQRQQRLIGSNRL